MAWNGLVLDKLKTIDRFWSLWIWCIVMLCIMILWLKVSQTFQEYKKNGIQFQNLSDTKSNNSCIPVRHVYFVKIPKTGSSTMANIIHRLAYQNNLTMLYPYKKGSRPYDYPGLHPLDILNVLENNNNKLSLSLDFNQINNSKLHKFDVYTPHSKFNYVGIMKYFKEDVKIITSCRHPLKRIISHFYFHNSYKKLKIPVKENKLEYFLKHMNNYTMYYNNVMADFLGFTNEIERNEEEVEKYLKFLGKTISHVVITEKYDESLVLLRRKFCWNTKDILHFNFYNKSYENKDNEDKIREYEYRYAQSIKGHTQFDYKIYNYFMKRHMEYKNSEGTESVKRELEIYSEINNKVTSFCFSFCKDMKSKFKSLKIEKNEFSDSFTVTHYDCMLMSQPLSMYIRLIKQKQFDKVCQYTRYKSTYATYCPETRDEMVDPCNHMQYVQISN